MAIVVELARQTKAPTNMQLKVRAQNKYQHINETRMIALHAPNSELK